MRDGTYHDWLITEPTTRRLFCEGVWPPAFLEETAEEGLRIFVTGDTDGDNNLYVVAASEDDFDRAYRAITKRELPWPSTRFGTWRRYNATVAWARAIFGLLGYEPTAEESALFAALEDYGQRAPERVCGRVREAVAA